MTSDRRSGTALQVVTPTFADIGAAIYENKEWTGRQNAKEDMNKMEPTPGFTRAKASASDPARWVAEALNTLTGGTALTPGILSPTPDQIDYLVAQAFGGMGRETMKTLQTVRARTPARSYRGSESRSSAALPARRPGRQRAGPVLLRGQASP